MRRLRQEECQGERQKARTPPTEGNDEEASGGPARPVALVEARVVAWRAIQARSARSAMPTSAAARGGPPEGVPGMGDYWEVRVLYGPW